MLAEAIRYISTPCPAYARRMGYLHEAIATAARYQRCHRSWQPHLENSRLFIQQAAAKTQHQRTALILGCGNCYDIPLEWLCRTFQTVICTDIVLLRHARQLIHKYNAISERMDITGIAETLYGKRDVPTVFPTLTRFLNNPEIDLIVSANILSQLPLIPCQWLEKFTHWSKEKRDFLSQHIIQSHLDYLHNFSATHCLISDISIETRSIDGIVIDRFSPCHGISLPTANTKWEWNVAPVGEISKTSETLHIVAASIW